VKDVGSRRVTKGLAGIIGVATTLVVGTVIFGGIWLVVRRRSAREPAPTGPPTAR